MFSLLTFLNHPGRLKKQFSYEKKISLFFLFVKDTANCVRCETQK